MLNTAGESLRPGCRGGQGHCPKPVEKEEKDAMKWHCIIFNIHGNQNTIPIANLTERLTGTFSSASKSHSNPIQIQRQ